MRKPITQYTELELLKAQKEGIDAENFLKNDFYVTAIKPELDAQRAMANEDGSWKPGRSTDTNEVMLFNAYNSGVKAGLNGIFAVVKTYVATGIAASKEMQRRAPKKEGKNAMSRLAAKPAR